MNDRVGVVTGPTGGIGQATAAGLARAGMVTVLVGRNRARLDTARDEIQAGQPDARVEIVTADLGDQPQVRAAAAELLDRFDRLDVLVNNAAIIPRHREQSPQGIELQLAVNVVAPFLLCQLLGDRLASTEGSRIVNVASDAHRFGKLDLDDLQRTRRRYGRLGMARYGETKLMDILFTRELARRLAATGVIANSVHPGTVATGLGDPPGPLRPLLRRFMKTPAEGARTSLHCALSPDVAGTSGQYFADSRISANPPMAAASNPQNQRRLWELLEDLVA